MRQFTGISAKCPKKHQFWGAEGPILLDGYCESGPMTPASSPGVRVPELPALADGAEVKCAYRRNCRRVLGDDVHLVTGGSNGVIADSEPENGRHRARLPPEFQRV